MAELLAQWLNEEIGLSKKVTNFEEDFASGYLLGELLYKFNQQSDFQQFSTKHATSHFVMNFEKLEPTLRSLHVQFNSKTVERIMTKERGQALRLLYQLKMVLEKVYPPADISIVAKTGTFGDNQPAQRIAHSKPKYDEVSHSFFKQRLGKLNRAQKDIDLELHQQKYEEEMQRQAAQAAKADNNDVVEDAMKKQEMRRIQINKLQRNAGFMEEWLAKGVEDWKANMNIKREREATQLEFDFTQAEKYNKITKQKLQDAQDEVHDGIKAFEKNLKAQGISTKVSKEVADKAITDTLNGKPWQGQATGNGAPEMSFTKTFDAKVSTKKGNFTLTSTGLKQRTKKTVTDEQRKEREKRRRRLINQQSTVMVDLEHESRENHVFELMKRQSRQEKELDYEAWRTTQCKNIIIENRNLREKQYEQRRIYDVQLGVEKEEKLIAEMQEASVREMGEMMKRTSELKVYEQQFKLKQRTELCSELMDSIFDIADEAYNHMQDLDAKEWDSRNWDNWLTLFVHKKKIAGTMAELLNTESTDASTEVKSDAHTQLDETELVDFVKNTGQWPTTLVSENKLNLADVLNPKVEAAAPVKGAKPVGKAPVAAEVVLEEGDLEVADKPANNYLFGDVIDQLIKLYYPQRPELKHPPTPNWLALKVCLVGYPFTGKKTQAALIKQKYGLDVYVMEDLINEALEFNKGDKKFEQPAEPIKDDGSDYAGLSEDETLQKDVNEELHEISQLISDQLHNGEEISDQLYVRLFINKIRTTYAYKCPVTKRRELKEKAQRYVEINKRVGEIAQEFLREDLPKKQKKALADEQAALEIELSSMDTLPSNGWVLVDFPSNYAQAKLLEEALSGYKPNEEKEPTDREKETKDALLLVQPHTQGETITSLIPSGLDAVIWFDCPVDECLRRSDGRRFDAQHEEHTRYHVFDMKPPTDQSPLCERLIPLSEDNNCVQGLPDRFVAFDQNTASMQRWLKQFGEEDRNRILLRVLSASESIENVQYQIQGTLNLILEHRQERFEAIRDELAAKIQISIDQEKKEADIEMLKDNSTSSVAGSQARMSPSLSQNKSVKQGLTGKRGSEVATTIAAAPVQSATAGTAVDVIQTSARAPTFGRNNIELEFRPVLIRLWQELSQNYRAQMKKIFRNVRRQREISFKQKASIQQKFLIFLQRLDNKQELLDQFVRDFNQFSDDFPDLREDNATKEELHQRCDVLSDELWEIVEERKEHNIEERKKIMESGSVENGLEFLTICAQQFMQAELDKFKISVQIIHDYYFAIEEKSTHEITGSITSELAFEGEDMPQIEAIAEGSDNTKIESYSYPRLEKLLQNALKQQVVPDVTQVQTVVGGADKKGGKAPPPKKPANVKETENETVVEESIYVKEMREAVKTEKSILRFRLVQIRNWTLQRLQEHRQSAINMYKKFDDWIQVAQKTEMDTIEEMCSVIKRAIEDEQKIQHELRIKFMDFTVDNSTLNYVNPPIPKLEALEEWRNDRLCIPQLQCLIQEFNLISKSTGDLLQNRELANLLFSKIKNSAHFGGYHSALPESWNSYGLVQINQMIRNIDHKNTGYVNWRTFMTYMILYRSKVPSAKEISRIEKMLTYSEVNKEQFIEGTYWFEETEQSKDRENALVFDRPRMIKELLFLTNADIEGKVLHVGRLATTWGQISQRAGNADTTFQGVLFSKVKI